LAKPSSGAAVTVHEPSPLQIPPVAVARSHQIEFPEACAGKILDHKAVLRAADEASDWDEAQLSRAISLSLADQRSSTGLVDIDDAFSHNEFHNVFSLRSSSHTVAGDVIVKQAGAERGAIPSCGDEGNQGSECAHHDADECAFDDHATLTGGCMPASPGRVENVAAAAQDDSILDISFQYDDLRAKPTSKRKVRVLSATAKQQLEKHQLEASEDVDFTPTIKRPRARTGMKTSAKVVRSEEHVAKEQSETLSRKNLVSALKSAKLGLLRPGAAAECRCVQFAAFYIPLESLKR
jgi:hypothetical protein